MSVYLTIFSKLRYLGLVEIDDNYTQDNVINNINSDKNIECSEKCESCENCGGCNKNKYKIAILNTLRGIETGVICGKLTQEQQDRYKKFCLEENGEQLRGPEPMLQSVEFIRFANNEDLEENDLCRRDEGHVLVRAREILSEHNLSMKLVDVEYVLDRKKLFFYFTSEQRVDFRAYVRDLARDFRTRIEMRQIGVRDESRAVKGIASCGRPCCCSYWLHHLTPIGIKMVKEQKLALNPTKISGICGRLMCCMAYEAPNYSELWDKLPPPNTKIKAGDNFYIVESIDLGTESVNIRFPSGKLVPVAVKEFENFNAVISSGGEWGEEAKQEPTFAERRRREALRPRLMSSAYKGIKSVKNGADVNNNNSKDSRDSKDSKDSVNNFKDGKDKNIKSIKNPEDERGGKNNADRKGFKGDKNRAYRNKNVDKISEDDIKNMKTEKNIEKNIERNIERNRRFSGRHGRRNKR